MTIRQQWLTVLAIVAALAGGVYALTHFLGDEIFPLTVGSRAPSFSAQTLDGETKTLADYQGKVVFLNIWATWCLPCREEMPSMQKLHEEFGDRGLAIVAVSIDDPGAEEQIRDFARQYGLTFEILHDPAGGIRRLYQTTGVPESFVIGPDGTIRRKQIGAIDWYSDANRALFARLLGTGDPAGPLADGPVRIPAPIASY